jgi:tRNA A-37 threonylcarbamoyl transferase component Bud32
VSVRRLLRGSVPEGIIDGAAREAAARADEPLDSVTVLEADNWLSTPCVVNERHFLKVISEQNSVVHALLTAGRNLGVFSSGRERFFEHFATPVEMAEHELEATRRLREAGVNAPEPRDAFGFDGHGVLVLEYLPSFRALDALPPAEVRAHVPTLFEALSRMHDAGVGHGDLRAENVLVADGELYLIDATKLRPDGIAEARAYDLACALAALEPLIGAREAVAGAAAAYPPEALRAAERFLSFVNIRPDHRFDAAALTGELGKELT